MRGKRIHQNVITGQKGVNLIEKAVLAMGFVWQQSGQIEAGIDGLIEIRNPVTGEMSNSVVRVQAKTISGSLRSDSGTHFEYTCNERDIDYWLHGNVPVVLIVIHLPEEKLYWVHINSYFADPVVRASHRIRFDKVHQLFDMSAAGAVAALAVRETSSIYSAPVRADEVVYTNLLPVVRMPSRIYVATTEFRERREIYPLLESGSQRVGGEWLLSGGMILSIHDLSDRRFDVICDRGSVEDFDVSEWLDSDDSTKQRDIAWLLRECLREKLYPEVRYRRDVECFHFLPSRDIEKRRTVSYVSNRNRTKKLVYIPYHSKRDPSKFIYFRHSAFSGRFRRFGTDWFLEINPTYVFTSDGYQLHPYHEDYLSKIKRLERNQSVFGQTKMWAEYMGRPDDMFRPYPHLGFGELRYFKAHTGIDDKSWLTLESEQEESLMAKDSLLDLGLDFDDGL